MACAMRRGSMKFNAMERIVRTLGDLRLAWAGSGEGICQISPGELCWLDARRTHQDTYAGLTPCEGGAIRNRRSGANARATKSKRERRVCLVSNNTATVGLRGRNCTNGPEGSRTPGVWRALRLFEICLLERPREPSRQPSSCEAEPYLVSNHVRAQVLAVTSGASPYCRAISRVISNLAVRWRCDGSAIAAG